MKASLLAPALLVAAPALGQTTITGTAGGGDSWNLAANWTAGVPTGALDATVAAGLTAQVDNAGTPSYWGELTVETGSILKVSGAAGSEVAFDGVSRINLHTGSDLQLNVGADVSFPPLTLHGDARLSTLFGASDWQKDKYDKISGAHKLTLEHFNGHEVHLGQANEFSELVVDTLDRWHLYAKAPGCLGTGDVTVNPRTDGRSASLHIDVAGAFAAGATLTLNGSPGQGGFSGDGSDYVVMNANETVGVLFVYGVQYPDGTYDSSEPWLMGSGTLTVQAPAIGTNYCGPANLNSSGQPAAISAWGDPVPAMNNLTLVASAMPANELGYFLCSETQGFISLPGASQGNLCLSAKIGRFAAQVSSTGSAGEFSIPVDLTAMPVSRRQAVQPGETWHFQAWFKDGASSNFTDGLSVAFQ